MVRSWCWCARGRTRTFSDSRSNTTRRERKLVMNILRGTFRLYIVIALLVAAYYGLTGYMVARKSDQENRQLWTTLRCGERFLDRDMSAYRSPVRPEVFDIGKAGCSTSTSWATFQEIREAAAQSEPPEYWRGFG